jgi:CSLREA domain-containing protein
MFTVNSTTDPGDGVCDASECTLREAIQEANELGPGGPHTIVLTGGKTYTLTRAGAGEDAAAKGDLDIVGDMTIGVTSGTAVVRGTSGWDDRIFDVFGSGAAVELRGVRIENGAGDPGAGIWNAGTLTLTNTTVSGNRAEHFGGGIYNAGALTLTNSTVSGNSAGNGGGIYNAVGALTLTNSTVSGNSALGDGGGIWNTGTVTANNVTIARNVADANADGAGNGGGVSNVSGGTVRVANTIIGTNVDQSRLTILAARQVPECAGSLTSQGYNLVQTTTGCTIGGNTTGNITGRDPQLGPLQDNGGPTFTHALLILTSKLGDIPSPAIDAGSPGGATACPSRDQRGVLRLDGNADGVARCDIGAYEYVPPFLRPPLGTWALAPADAVVRAGERLRYTLTWTVPPPLGWRTLDTLELRFLDDRGTALWVRFQEIAGSPGFFSVVDPRNDNVGPAFAPGSPNRLESEFAALYLAASSVDGPPGPKVTLTLTLGFKPHAAGRTYDVLVLATNDAGEVQGFHRAGTVAVTG